MKTKKGYTGNYFWLETTDVSKDIGSFISDFSSFIVDKNLAIISFDSGPFVPGNEEIKRGWVCKDEIAYFNFLNEKELHNSIHSGYDQWFLFDAPMEIVSASRFVNYAGFTVDLDAESKHLAYLAERFWKEIEIIKPSKFILCGDYFIYGTVSEQEIEKIEQKWCLQN